MDKPYQPYSLDSLHKRSGDLPDLQRAIAHDRVKRSTESQTREFSAWVTPCGVGLRETLDADGRHPSIERVSMRFDEFDELASLMGYVKKDPNA